MTKCPNCGSECEQGVKFCMECGTAIPQTKECPMCRASWPLTSKFCAECGYNFNAVKTSGSVIGDKNVIAGDVNINSSTTNNNTTINNVTNTTTNNVTNVINQDETKRLATCGVCGKQVVITEALACKKCGKSVCADHVDALSGKCISCHQADEELYKGRMRALIADGVLGIQEEKDLTVLSKSLCISEQRASELQSEVERELGGGTEVRLEIRGATLHVGREPIDRMEALDYDGVPTLSAKSPETCYESIYAIDTVNAVVAVTLDWSADGVDRHVEPSWGASAHGPRNIVFQDMGETFGAFEDAPATLYITETFCDDKDFNGARVVFKCSFKVFGEFKPADVVIRCGTLEFDEDFQRLMAVEYRGRVLRVKEEPEDVANMALARDSWVEAGGVRYEYNVWSPKSCRMKEVSIESRVLSIATADFESKDAAVAFLRDCKNDHELIRARIWELGQQEDLACAGVFFETSNARVRIANRFIHSNYDSKDSHEFVLHPHFTSEDREDLDSFEHVGDGSFKYENVGAIFYNGKPEDGRARITYFERGRGTMKFNFFCFDKFSPERLAFYCFTTGKVLNEDQKFVAETVLKSFSYTVPSFGKREKYVYNEDEMREEVDCFGPVIKPVGWADEAWCVVECAGMAEVVKL